jgi:microcystin-dependent protein
MPWNGSAPNQTYGRTDGTRTGTQVWQQADAAGVDIVSPDHDTHDQDIADAINACLKKDGGNAATSNIPMGGFTLTNIAAATARTQPARFSDVQDGKGVYVPTVGGTANAITLTTGYSVSAYAAGQTFRFLASGINSGAVTINLDGIGAKDVYVGGSPVTAGMLSTGKMATVTYDGTRFQLEAESPAAISVGTVMAWPISTVPTGWLECDGSAVSRSTYSALFAVIGDDYGPGNGTTTFNLPNYKDYFLRGFDASGTDAGSRTDRGDGTTGANVGTKQAAATASHTHTGTTASNGAHTHTYTAPDSAAGGDGGASVIDASALGTTSSDGAHTHTFTTDATGGTETRGKNITVKWIILALPGASLAFATGEVVSVKDFGARGDNTDSTAAFQAAAASFGSATAGPFAESNGGILFVPKGVYQVNDETLFAVPGVRVVGEGIEATKIYVSANMGAKAVFKFDQTSSSYSAVGVAVEDLSISMEGFTGHGVWMRKPYDGSGMRNVLITNVADAYHAVRVEEDAGNVSDAISQTLVFENVWGYHLNDTATTALFYGQFLQEVTIFQSKMAGDTGVDTSPCHPWHFEDCRAITMYGCSASQADNHGVLISATTRDVDLVLIDGMTFETIAGAVKTEVTGAFRVKSLVVRAPRYEGTVTHADGTYDLNGATEAFIEARGKTVNMDADSTAQYLLLSSPGDLTLAGGNAAVTGHVQTSSMRLRGWLSRNAPVTKTADFTVGATENWIIVDRAAGATTVTLPAAASFTGRELHIKTIQNQTVDSNASNVVPLIGGSAGTAILTNTAGKWATLVSDGTSWYIMQGN